MTTGARSRKLLKPEEVLALNPRVAITFTPGYRPILTRTVRWFEEPGLFRRSFLGRFTASCKALFRAFVFMVLGLLAAYVASAVALERERYHPPEHPAFQQWR